MKNTSILLFLIIGAFFIFGSCQETTQNVKNLNEFSKTLKDLGEQLEKGAEELSEKNKARKAKGDTVAIHYNKLKEYLPSISGYTIDGEPDGQISGAQGLSYSQLTAKYKSNNGKEKVKVTLVDYNAALPLYTLATAALKSNFFIENNRETTKGIDLGIEGVAGMKTIKKKDKKSNVILGVGDRFMVSIEASGQAEQEFAVSVAKKMKLKELAGM